LRWTMPVGLAFKEKGGEGPKKYQGPDDKEEGQEAKDLHGWRSERDRKV